VFSTAWPRQQPRRPVDLIVATDRFLAEASIRAKSHSHAGGSITAGDRVGS